MLPTSTADMCSGLQLWGPGVEGAGAPGRLSVPSQRGNPPAANVWPHSPSKPPRPVADIPSEDPGQTGGGQWDVRDIFCEEGSQRVALEGWSLCDHHVPVDNLQKYQHNPGPSSLSPGCDFYPCTWSLPLHAVSRLDVTSSLHTAFPLDAASPPGHSFSPTCNLSQGKTPTEVSS